MNTNNNILLIILILLTILIFVRLVFHFIIQIFNYPQLNKYDFILSNINSIFTTIVIVYLLFTKSLKLNYVSLLISLLLMKAIVHVLVDYNIYQKIIPVDNKTSKKIKYYKEIWSELTNIILLILTFYIITKILI